MHASENPHKTPLGLTFLRLKSETLNKMQYLFNTAYFLAQEDLAFAKFERLCSLQSLNGVGIGTLYTNDKHAREFVGYIAEAIRLSQFEQLKEVRYFSFMSSGSGWIMDYEMDMEWPNKIHNPYGLWIFYGFSIEIRMDYGFFMDFQPKSLWIMDFLWN